MSSSSSSSAATLPPPPPPGPRRRGSGGVECVERGQVRDGFGEPIGRVSPPTLITPPATPTATPTGGRRVGVVVAGAFLSVGSIRIKGRRHALDPLPHDLSGSSGRLFLEGLVRLEQRIVGGLERLVLGLEELVLGAERRMLLFQRRWRRRWDQRRRGRGWRVVERLRGGGAHRRCCSPNCTRVGRCHCVLNACR